MRRVMRRNDVNALWGYRKSSLLLFWVFLKLEQDEVSQQWLSLSLSSLQPLLSETTKCSAMQYKRFFLFIYKAGAIGDRWRPLLHVPLNSIPILTNHYEKLFLLIALNPSLIIIINWFDRRGVIGIGGHVDG